MHSTVSDGVCKPQMIAREASRIGGLRAIALTDHDSLAGLAAAREACGQEGIEFVPGVEITTKHDGRAVHMLGYFVDHADAGLAGFLAANKKLREDRAYQMADLMHADGLPLSAEAMRETDRKSVV